MDTRDSRECWKVDSEVSTLKFSLRHALLGEIRGQFWCWGGEVLVDRTDPTRSSVRIWVDLSSIDTGSPSRDEYILETELFDMRWEPGLVFDSARVEMVASERAAVLGWLTLRSWRAPIAVSVDAGPPPDGCSASGRMVSTAHASLDRAALGLRRTGRRSGDWLSERLLGETIEIEAHVEATRQPPAMSRGPRSDQTHPALSPSASFASGLVARASASSAMHPA